MTKKALRSDEAAPLRRLAENSARTRAQQLPHDLEHLPADQVQHLIHELHVSQIELEIQNENLNRIQEELEASREEYYDLYNLAPVGYLTLNDLGLIKRANLTAAELLGVTQESLVNHMLSSFIWPTDVDIYYLHCKNLFVTGKKQVFDIRMMRTGGSHLWTRMDITAMQDNDGNPLCRMILSDISAAKQAEEEVRESENRLRLALDAAHIGDWEIDLIQGKSSWSVRYAQIFGLAQPSPASGSADVFLPYIHPEDRPIVDASLKESAETCREWYSEFRIIRPDKEERWVWARGSFFKDSWGRQSKMFGMVADITERKLAEERLKKTEELRRNKERNCLTGKIRELDGKIESSLEMQLGRSAVIQGVINDIKKLASADFSLIIEGETGTGKSLIANIIHNLSERASGPFIVLDLSVIPENLVESELFGYEKGAFTGADKRKKGYFEIANGGTVFIDELQNMTPFVQTKILKVVEEKRFYPVGSNHPVESSMRIIGATNTCIRKAVQEKRFREDLYYRLNEASLRLPSLRDRRADIGFFIQKFLIEVSSELSKPLRITDENIVTFLEEQQWPGNVRELKNVIRSAALFSESNILTMDDVGRAMSEMSLSADTEEAHGMAGLHGPLSIPEAEKYAISLALSHTGGNKTKAAEILQITLKTLLTKIKKYSL